MPSKWFWAWRYHYKHVSGNIHRHSGRHFVVQNSRYSNPTAFVWWLRIMHNLLSTTSSVCKRLHIACVAWRFWLGALSNKGGRGQRNREEIGAEATWNISRAFVSWLGCQHFISDWLGKLKPNRLLTGCQNELKGAAVEKATNPGRRFLFFFIDL